MNKTELVRLKRQLQKQKQEMLQQQKKIMQKKQQQQKEIQEIKKLKNEIDNLKNDLRNDLVGKTKKKLIQLKKQALSKETKQTVQKGMNKVNSFLERIARVKL